MIALRTSIADAPLPSEASDQAPSGAQGPARTEAIACVLAAMVLVVLSAGVANVALPVLAHAFQVTPAVSVRVVSAYQLGLVMALLPCAALGESLGYRAVFTAGVGLFTGAAVLCALAPSLHWLVAARFLQGLGGAAVMALGVALLRFVVPQAQLAAAIGWNALAVALSSAAAPTVGAVLLSSASWPWLFAVNLPLGLAVLLATRGLPEVPGTARALDATSMALNAVAFGALIAGAELLPAAPALGAGLLAASVLSATLLLRRELPKEAPLVPLDLLRSRSFRISVIASVACFAGQASALVALPFYLRHSFGQEPLTTGLLITPWPLSVAIVAPVAGRLADRISTAWLCATGAVCLALGLTALALWPAHGSALALVPFVALCGAGFGLFQVPNNRNMFLAAPRARSAAAGGMQGTARLAGQTAGSVVMTLLFMLTPIDAAPRIGLGIGAVLTLSAGIVSALRAGSRRGHDGGRMGRWLAG
ncbi:MFS transporter [Sorangium sp. So ce1000]|uniref:MFS transporter n=1 Tax=Sorangium sp. So ce1000 TaxID=3133325 RepID=UPI003F623FB0